MGEWPRATIGPFSKLHVEITDGCPRLAKTRGGGRCATRRVGEFTRGTVARRPVDPAPHGPFLAGLGGRIHPLRAFRRARVGMAQGEVDWQRVAIREKEQQR